MGAVRKDCEQADCAPLVFGDRQLQAACRVGVCAMCGAVRCYSVRGRRYGVGRFLAGKAEGPRTCNELFFVRRYFVICGLPINAILDWVEFKHVRFIAAVRSLKPWVWCTHCTIDSGKRGVSSIGIDGGPGRNLACLIPVALTSRIYPGIDRSPFCPPVQRIFSLFNNLHAPLSCPTHL
jgi:hypothetical protein